MKIKKVVINVGILLVIGLGLYWWQYEIKQQKSGMAEIKNNVATPEVPSPDQSTPVATPVSSSSSVASLPTRTTKPIKEQLTPDLEAKYKAALKTGIPDKLTSMIQLFMEQRLEMAPDKGINLNPTDTPSTTSFDLTWRDQGQDYKMHVDIDKAEASYTSEHYIYPYAIALWVDNKVKLQFTGHMNMNGELPVYQDLDVIAYEPGDWEKNIKKLTITN